MKNNAASKTSFYKLTIALIALLSASFFSFSQTIPNGGFEEWVQESYGEEPTNWGDFTMQLLGDYGTIQKSTDASTGNFAMELNSVEAVLNDSTLTFIPSVWLNLKNFNSDSAKFPIDSHLTSLSGQIKLDLAQSDSNSVSISILLTKENELVAIGAKEWVQSTAGDYVKFNIPLLYFANVEGDSVQVIITGGSKDFPVAGNVMKLDDFQLSYGESAKTINVDFSVDMSGSLYQDSLVGLFHNFNTFWDVTWMTPSGNNDYIWTLSEELPMGKDFQYIFALGDLDSNFYSGEWYNSEPDEPCLSDGTDTTMGQAADKRMLMLPLSTDKDTTLAMVCWESCDSCENSALGVNMSEDINEFKVFPNPAKSKTFIDFTQGGMKTIDVTIYSMIGQIVLSKGDVVLETGQLELDLSMINQGHYIVVINTGGTLYQQKLIIE